MSEFEKLLPNYCDSITKTVAYAISYADAEDQEKILGTLRGSVQQYVESSERFQHINGLVNQLSSKKSDSNVKEILKNFNHGVASFKPNSSENEYLRQHDRRVADLKKKLTGVRDEEDDDGDLQVIEEDSENLICPISKVRMTEPMKNDICGHVYDKASVVALLNRNAATRCPIVGCSNKEYLNMNHLKSDVVRKMCMDADLN